MFLTGFSIEGHAIWVAGIQGYEWDGGAWAKDTKYSISSSAGFRVGVSTLPADGTAPYMVVSYVGGSSTGHGYGAWNGLPPEWSGIVRFKAGVSPDRHTSNLVFGEWDVEGSPCVAVDEYFLTAVVLEPRPGYTWADAPDGYIMRGFRVGECNASTVGSVIMNHGLVRARNSVYVEQDTGSNTATGSQEDPYADLASGIHALRNGTVHLGPGVYEDPDVGGIYSPGIYSSGARVISIQGSPTAVIRRTIDPGSLHLTGSCLVVNCTLDLTGQDSTWLQAFRGSLVLEDCEIVGARFSVGRNGELVLRSCDVHDNQSHIECFSFSNNGNMSIENCIVYDNAAESRAFFYMQSTWSGRLEVKHSTIVGNTTGAGAPFMKDTGAGTVDIVNSIIYYNSPGGFEGAATQFSATYSCSQDCWEGTGNICEDPLLFSLATQDLRLRQSSPCVNSGTPSDSLPTDFLGNPRDTRPDMGAYEAGYYARGDVSGNGVIDNVDARLCLQIALHAVVPTVAQEAAADVNGDGDVTVEDAEILAEYVIGIRSTLP